MEGLPVVGRIGKFSGRMLFDRARRRLRQINNRRLGGRLSTLRLGDAGAVDLGHAGGADSAEICACCSLRRNAPDACGGLTDEYP
jgi:hypothetical protein